MRESYLPGLTKPTNWYGIMASIKIFQFNLIHVKVLIKVVWKNQAHNHAILLYECNRKENKMLHLREAYLQWFQKHM